MSPFEQIFASLLNTVTAFFAALIGSIFTSLITPMFESIASSLGLGAS